MTVLSPFTVVIAVMSFRLLCLTCGLFLYLKLYSSVSLAVSTEASLQDAILEGAPCRDGPRQGCRSYAKNKDPCQARADFGSIWLQLGVYCGEHGWGGLVKFGGTVPTETRHQTRQGAPLRWAHARPLSCNLSTLSGRAGDLLGVDRNK